MVSTTTAANDTAPTPGTTEATAPSRTSATRIDSMKMSIIDQRPTVSMTR